MYRPPPKHKPLPSGRDYFIQALLDGRDKYPNLREYYDDQLDQALSKRQKGYQTSMRGASHFDIVAAMSELTPRQKAKQMLRQAQKHDGECAEMQATIAKLSREVKIVNDRVVEAAEELLQYQQQIQAQASSITSSHLDEQNALNKEIEKLQAELLQMNSESIRLDAEYSNNQLRRKQLLQEVHSAAENEWHKLQTSMTDRLKQNERSTRAGMMQQESLMKNHHGQDLSAEQKEERTEGMEISFDKTIGHLLDFEQERKKLCRQYNNKNRFLQQLVFQTLSSAPFLSSPHSACSRQCVADSLLHTGPPLDSRVSSQVVRTEAANTMLVDRWDCACRVHPGATFALLIDDTSIDEPRIIEIRAE